MLDLSSNKLRNLIPSNLLPEGCSKFTLKSLLSLNLSDNPLTNIKETANAISIMIPRLTDLQISIYDERDVNYIIQTLPNLTYLNNILVRRD